MKVKSKNSRKTFTWKKFILNPLLLKLPDSISFNRDKPVKMVLPLRPVSSDKTLNSRFVIEWHFETGLLLESLEDTERTFYSYTIDKECVRVVPPEVLQGARTCGTCCCSSSTKTYSDSSLLITYGNVNFCNRNPIQDTVTTSTFLRFF